MTNSVFPPVIIVDTWWKKVGFPFWIELSVSILHCVEEKTAVQKEEEDISDDMTEHQYLLLII